MLEGMMTQCEHFHNGECMLYPSPNIAKCDKCHRYRQVLNQMNLSKDMFKWNTCKHRNQKRPYYNSWECDKHGKTVRDYHDCFVCKDYFPNPMKTNYMPTCSHHHFYKQTATNIDTHICRLSGNMTCEMDCMNCKDYRGSQPMPHKYALKPAPAMQVMKATYPTFCGWCGGHATNIHGTAGPVAKIECLDCGKETNVTLTGQIQLQIKKEFLPPLTLIYEQLEELVDDMKKITKTPENHPMLKRLRMIIALFSQ